MTIPLIFTKLYTKTFAIKQTNKQVRIKSSNQSEKQADKIIVMLLRQ